MYICIYIYMYKQMMYSCLHACPHAAIVAPALNIDSQGTNKPSTNENIQS